MYNKLLKEYQAEAVKVCTYLKSSISEQSLILTKHEYIIATADSDSYTLFNLLKTTHLGANNFAIMSSHAKHYFNLSQSKTQSYNEYEDQQLQAYKQFCYDFEDPLNKGTIKLNDLAVILFLQGLNYKTYSFLLDKYYTISHYLLMLLKLFLPML